MKPSTLGCKLGAGLVCLTLLSGCWPAPVTAPPAFVGSFEGYLSREGDLPLGFRVVTTLHAQGEFEYSVTGEAFLEGVRYLLEGGEVSNGGVRYQALPPAGNFTATLHDGDGQPQFTLGLTVFYGSGASWDREFLGALYAGDTRVGSVTLRAAIPR